MEHACKRPRILAPINTLPKELIVEICNYLDCIDLWHLSRACKLLLYIVKGLKVWYEIRCSVIIFAPAEWVYRRDPWKMYYNMFSNSFATGECQDLVESAVQVLKEVQDCLCNYDPDVRWTLFRQDYAWKIFSSRIRMKHSDRFECIFRVIADVALSLIEFCRRRDEDEARPYEISKKVYLSTYFLRFKFRPKDRFHQSYHRASAKIDLFGKVPEVLLRIRAKKKVVAQIKLTLPELYIGRIKSLFTNDLAWISNLIKSH